MTEPFWLLREHAELIHERVLEKDGGSHGLRDANLLESALMRPQNLYMYGESDIFELAASYAEGIARNHAFVDGNKRTAFQTAVMFLYEHGFELERAKGTEHADVIEQLAQGYLTREDVAQYFKAHCHNID